MTLCYLSLIRGVDPLHQIAQPCHAALDIREATRIRQPYMAFTILAKSTSRHDGYAGRLEQPCRKLLRREAAHINAWKGIKGTLGRRKPDALHIATRRDDGCPSPVKLCDHRLHTALRPAQRGNCSGLCEG